MPHADQTLCRSWSSRGHHPKQCQAPDVGWAALIFCTRHDAGASAIDTAPRTARVGQDFNGDLRYGSSQAVVVDLNCNVSSILRSKKAADGPCNSTCSLSVYDSKPRRRSPLPNAKRPVNTTAQIESRNQRYFRIFPLAFSDNAVETAALRGSAIPRERGRGRGRDCEFSGGPSRIGERCRRQARAGGGSFA